MMLARHDILTGFEPQIVRFPRFSTRKRPYPPRFAPTSWKNEMELAILPTNGENLSVKIENGKLVLSGKSETSEDKKDLKMKSIHQWSREMAIPEHVDQGSIKVKLSENQTKLKIESEPRKKDTAIEIPIIID